MDRDRWDEEAARLATALRAAYEAGRAEERKRIDDGCEDLLAERRADVRGADGHGRDFAKGCVDGVAVCLGGARGGKS